MSRRPFALLVVSLAALTLSACADATAPTPAASGTRQIQASGQANHDVTDPDVCRGGYMTSTGKAC
jgi:ABC-type oligopeptide transport system substrate-binding subunit